jgi:hypothetical protein
MLSIRARRCAQRRAAGQTVYFEGDSHWTERGAFIAYSLLIERVRRHFLHVEALAPDAFVIRKGRPMASDLRGWDRADNGSICCSSSAGPHCARRERAVACTKFVPLRGGRSHFGQDCS